MPSISATTNVNPQLPRQTLSRLSRTSTRYRAIAAPLLQDDALLLSANGRTLRPQAGDVAASVRRATSVTVASPVPSDTVSGSIRGRCPGCDLADSGREAETGEALIRDVLAGCEPGRLRKFTWVSHPSLSTHSLALSPVLTDISVGSSESASSPTSSGPPASSKLRNPTSKNSAYRPATTASASAARPARST